MLPCIIKVFSVYDCGMFVNRLDKSFIAHSPEQAYDLEFHSNLCSLGVQCKEGNLSSSSDSSIPTDVMKVS